MYHPNVIKCVTDLLRIIFSSVFSRHMNDINNKVIIGNAAKLTDIKVETIRYYEKISILDSPMRIQVRNRLYTQQNIEQLNFIKRSRELGFSLNEIRELMSLSTNSKEDCNTAQSIANTHLSTIRCKINDLQRLAHVLSNLSIECSHDQSDECPILSSLYGYDSNGIHSDMDQHSPI